MPKLIHWSANVEAWGVADFWTDAYLARSKRYLIYPLLQHDVKPFESGKCQLPVPAFETATHITGFLIIHHPAEHHLRFQS